MAAFEHEAHGFWLEVGRTLDVWQKVEQQLCEIFVTTIQSPISDSVRASFYKVISIGTKRSMITAALSIRVEDQALTERWKKLSKQIEDHSKRRNSLAHGTRWDNAGTSIMGPHLNDVTLRDRHMQLNGGEFLDQPAIHALQREFWTLVTDLTIFNNDLGLHTMSFGKPINLPSGRL